MTRNNDNLTKDNEGQQVIDQNDSSITEQCYNDRTTVSTMRLRRALRQGGNSLCILWSQNLQYIQNCQIQLKNLFLNLTLYFPYRKVSVCFMACSIWYNYNTISQKMYHNCIWTVLTASRCCLPGNLHFVVGLL